MANRQSPETKLQEEEVLKLIEETQRKIHANELAGLLIPTHLVHDCEVDDQLCWLLLEYLHRKLGTELTVLCQVRGAGGYLIWHRAWHQADGAMPGKRR